MIDFNKVIKQVSLNTGYNIDLVKIICRHPFIQTASIMKSDSTQDILFNGLFKFKLKRRFKEDKTKKYTSK